LIETKLITYECPNPKPYTLKQIVYGVDFVVILATLPYRDRWRNAVEVECARERERDCVCVCVREKERERVCVRE